MTEHKVRIAEWVAAAAPDRMAAIGLGSCVAIVLHDAHARVGGMAHVLLPTQTTARDAEQPGRCASSAVPRLLADIRALGGNGTVTARLVGGASLFGALLRSEGTGAIGERNVAAARAALAEARVRVVGELVGGTAGRSVYFDLATGRVSVRSMRDGDRVL